MYVVMTLFLLSREGCWSRVYHVLVDGLLKAISCGSTSSWIESARLKLTTSVLCLVLFGPDLTARAAFQFKVPT